MTFEEKEKLARTRDAGLEAAAVRLQAARRVTGMTQGDLGQFGGVKKAAIANAEKARAYPGRSLLVYLHRQHRIDFNFMIAGEFAQLPQDVQDQLFVALQEIADEADQKQG